MFVAVIDGRRRIDFRPACSTPATMFKAVRLNAVTYPVEPAERTLGLVGFGASARAVAERARAFGLRLLAWARNPARHGEDAARLGVGLVELHPLLEESDYVSIHLPLTEQTRHLLGAAELAR